MRRNNGEGEEIYELEVSRYWLGLTGIKRVVHIDRADGHPIVRRDRMWARLYSKKSLKKLLNIKICSDGRNLILDGRQTELKDVKVRRYVRIGDAPLGKYITFSKWGF